MNNVSIRSFLGLAWSDFKKNWISLLMLTMGSVFLSALQGYINARDLHNVEMDTLIDSCGLTWIPAWYASYIVIFFMSVYGIVFTINLLDMVYGRKLSWFNVDFYAVIKTIVAHVVIVLPFLLLAFVGSTITLPESTPLITAMTLVLSAIYIISYYFILRSMFTGMMILEEKADILDAFYASWDLTQDRVLFIIKMACVQFLILLLGVVCLGIGLVIAIPVIVLMSMHLFKKLREDDQIKA